MKDSVQGKWEYFIVEARLVRGSQNVMFFDHYTHEYMAKKSDLDNYLAKLKAEGWEQTLRLWTLDINPDQKSYIFRRLRA